jgi:hypothetical protein
MYRSLSFCVYSSCLTGSDLIFISVPLCSLSCRQRHDETEIMSISMLTKYSLIWFWKTEEPWQYWTIMNYPISRKNGTVNIKKHLTTLICLRSLCFLWKIKVSPVSSCFVSISFVLYIFFMPSRIWFNFISVPLCSLSCRQNDRKQPDDISRTQRRKWTKCYTTITTR